MQNDPIIPKLFTGSQLFALTLLRILIGWHFLYEGLVKLFSPGGWTAEFYLENSVGPFSSIFKAMAGNPTVLAFVNQANIWGLILIGLFLFIGFWARWASIFGMILLFSYYFAYPPFAAYTTSMPVEGSYWIVNKNLIELASLLVLYLFPSGNYTGIDRLLRAKSGSE